MSIHMMIDCSFSHFSPQRIALKTMNAGEGDIAAMAYARLREGISVSIFRL